MEEANSYRRRYEQWVRDFAQPLYRYAYRLTGHAQIAEDLVQETFVEAWRSIARQKEEQRAKAWLFQILRFRHAHLLRDRSRRLQPVRLADSSDEHPADRMIQPLDELAEKDAIQTALEQLTPAMRDTFMMVFVEGCTCRQTAENLKIPLGTVLSRLDGARRALRLALGERAPERNESVFNQRMGEVFMTEWYPDEELRELANLPRGAAARLAMEARLGAIEPVEREYWIGYLRLTDRLYAELARVEVPPGFEERLLRIADQDRTAINWGRVIRKSLLGAAACVLLLLASKNLWDWYSTLPARPKALDDTLAMTISHEAVRDLDAHPVLDLASGDAGAVHDAIASHGAPFVLVLHPRGKADLVGGGVVDFHGTPAAYTRWKAGDVKYTVYQFDGTKMGVPAVFALADETPTELWHDKERYRVVIWPGKAGGCTWAAVCESDGAQDLFGGVTY